MRLLQCMNLLIVCDTQSRGINLAYAQPTSAPKPFPPRRRSAPVPTLIGGDELKASCYGRHPRRILDHSNLRSCRGARSWHQM